MDKKYALRITDKYISRLLLNDIIVHAAYLFGSYAKGNYREESDIDLAIVLDKDLNTFETEIKLMTLRKDEETLIEPHVFEEDDLTSSNPFIHEILTTGIKIR